jgi:hypothetical protein
VVGSKSFLSIYDNAQLVFALLLRWIFFRILLLFTAAIRKNRSRGLDLDDVCTLERLDETT